MNLIEIKQIGKLQRLDTARMIVDNNKDINDLAKAINNEPLRFRSTIAAVYMFDNWFRRPSCSTSSEAMLQEDYNKLVAAGARRVWLLDTLKKFNNLRKYYVQHLPEYVANGLVVK